MDKRLNWPEQVITISWSRIFRDVWDLNPGDHPIRNLVRYTLSYIHETSGGRVLVCIVRSKVKGSGSTKKIEINVHHFMTHNRFRLEVVSCSNVDTNRAIKERWLIAVLYANACKQTTKWLFGEMDRRKVAIWTFNVGANRCAFHRMQTVWRRMGRLF